MLMRSRWLQLIYVPPLFCADVINQELTIIYDLIAQTA